MMGAAATRLTERAGSGVSGLATRLKQAAYGTPNTLMRCSSLGVRIQYGVRSSAAVLCFTAIANSSRRLAIAENHNW